MDRKDVPWKAILYQYGVGIIAGISGVNSGAWLSWPSSSIKPLLNGEGGFNMTRAEISTMVSLLDLGNILTPIPASYFMDMYGRRNTFYTTAIMNVIASAAILMADNVWYLYLARLFAGMAKGVVFAVVPIYLAEIANVEIRGALSTMFIGSLNTGLFYGYIMGAFIPYESFNISIAVLPILFAILFYFVPESPYYLAMKEKEKKTIKSLAKYRQSKKDNESLLAEVKLVSETVKNDLEQKGRFIDILTTKSMRRASLIIILLAMFQRSSGLSPFLAYSTITLPEHGGGFTREQYMVIFSIILIIANYLTTSIIESWGRKKLLITSTVATCLVQVIAGTFYSFQSRSFDVSSWLWVPYACLVSTAFTYSIGLGFIPSTLVGELFPTNVKCYASSVSAVVMALTSLVINRIFREVADLWGVEYMFLFFIIACASCTIFIVLFVFETKGKTFAEIQNILKLESGDEVQEINNYIETKKIIFYEKN